MHSEVWDSFARSFDQHVCDIADTDATGVFDAEISDLDVDRAASRLVDFGCGRGTFLRKFAGHFASALGVDFSAEMLRLAQRRCHGLNAVRFLHRDLKCLSLPEEDRAHVAVCLNVVTSPEKWVREQLWAGLADCTLSHGLAMVVVPSWESANWVNACAKKKAAKRPRRVSQGGEVESDSFRQKFFEMQEVADEIAASGFDVLRVRKVWYPWSEEGLSGTTFRGEERPWDWLAVARRTAAN